VLLNKPYATTVYIRTAQATLLLLQGVFQRTGLFYYAQHSRSDETITANTDVPNINA